MKNWTNVRVAFITLTLIIAACNKEGGTSDIAGSESKTWEVTKLVNANGNRERLGRDQQNDRMQFYADGTFTANSSEQHSRGTWTHDEANNTLSLQFEDANVSQNYEVVELNRNRISLRTGDGSEMIMEAVD